MTINECAEHIGVTKQTIRNIMAGGKLPYVLRMERGRKKIEIEREDLEKFAEQYGYTIQEPVGPAEEVNG